MTALDLLEEFAAAFARGERPDVAAYLARAGGERDQLARLLDGFLRSTVPPPPSAEGVAALRARLSTDPPLVALRSQRAVRVDEVVDELLRTQGWAVAQRAKVKRYYQQLEGGLLDARRVALPVLEAVAALLGVRATDLEAYRAPPLAPAGAVFARATGLDARVQHAVDERTPEPDEVDRAFLSAR